MDPAALSWVLRIRETEVLLLFFGRQRGGALLASREARAKHERAG